MDTLLRIFANADPHYFGKLDADPDPHDSVVESWNRIRIKVEAVGAQNLAIKGRGRSKWRLGGSKYSSGESVDHWSQIHISLKH